MLPSHVDMRDEQKSMANNPVSAGTECCNPPVPLTSSEHLFLCKVGITAFPRLVGRMNI